MATATLLTTTGKGVVCGRMKGTNAAGGTQAEPVYVGWGTGNYASTSTMVSDTALLTPALEPRFTGTSSISTVNVPNDTYQVVATLTSSSTQTITEAASFDALTGGNIVVKGNFGGVSVNSGDSIQFTLRLTFS